MMPVCLKKIDISIIDLSNTKYKMKELMLIFPAIYMCGVKIVQTVKDVVNKNIVSYIICCVLLLKG